MASPMQQAASANLQKPKKRGLWGDIKAMYSRITEPMGYKPPAQQGNPYGNVSPKGRMMAQEVAQETGKYTAPKPTPKSDFVPYPTRTASKAEPSKTPRQLADEKRASEGRLSFEDEVAEIIRKNKR